MKTLRKDNNCEQTIFEIKMIKAILECQECHRTSELKDYKFRCTFCNSNNLLIKDGDEIIVESIEFE